MIETMMFISCAGVGFLGGMAVCRHESHRRYLEGYEKGFTTAKNYIIAYLTGADDHATKILDELEE